METIRIPRKVHIWSLRLNTKLSWEYKVKQLYVILFKKKQTSKKRKIYECVELIHIYMYCMTSEIIEDIGYTVTYYQ